jgi:hypothetical protein
VQGDHTGQPAKTHPSGPTYIVRLRELRRFTASGFLGVRGVGNSVGAVSISSVVPTAKAQYNKLLTFISKVEAMDHRVRANHENWGWAAGFLKDWEKPLIQALRR